MKLKKKKAEKAIRYYKGIEGENEREKSSLKMEFDRLKMIVNEQEQSKKLELSDFTNKMAFKGITTSIAMAWFIQCPGSFVFINYAMLIFEQSGTVLDPHISSIILAIVQIIGGLVSTQLGDTFGRKTTLFISLFGSLVGLFTFATYSYLRHNDYDVSQYMWLPVVSLSFIIFIASSGIVALAHICAIENFPPKVYLYKNYFKTVYRTPYFTAHFCLLSFLKLADSHDWHRFLFAVHQYGCIFGW